MGRSSQYNHYFQRIDIPGQNVIDIEEYFPGLLYEKADGINNIGKTKNVYTEEYADSDRKRYFLPDDNNYANEGTEVTMTFLVVGTPVERENIIHNFFEYVRKGVHRYWDNARNREFDFIVTNELKVGEERWHGSNPYAELTVHMQNLNGYTRPH